ncbi:CpsD/CapB family tyrosine-protein kinase [Chengkuizengella sp. 2205SS18-9]|uniref:non-specific protein-tyrosine kinase n=1 Tax=Chengkuizengella axinellae TaxID=3064388 RepID=A0ABT9IZG2_9BACL|nr:CpsD/CapB family tyrosine-protein kinase [Chengkuizengella sp. 2205SS18-9]MDP5274748.1 CpsD/CapB family tyrosine-protein kinase [Chengkuizengella sp. 2205SS18-9]
MLRLNRKKQNQSSQRSLVTLTNPKSPISEQYRTIRTNIQFAAVDQDIKSIVVTSSTPSEGKSTTTANLAIVFAQQGKKVLLVDADLRKPTMHYTFQLLNTYGLTNVLAGQAAMNGVISKTDNEHLSVITSGPIPPNPAEMLGSNAMKQFVKEAKQNYDIVLFDSPPVLAVTDAQILGNLSDGVILVVQSGKTEVEAAQKSKELLQQANTKILGTVLNQKKTSKKQGYYYYYGS